MKHPLNKSHTRAFSIIKSVMGRYAREYCNEEEFDIWNSLCYYRELLLRVIEYVKFYVTPEQISEFMTDISEGGHINDMKYIILDATMYFMFQIINDDILKSTNSQVLLNIIKTAVYANTSKSLIDALVGYLDNKSEQIFNDYITINVTLSKPNYYESLFSESV